MREAFILNPNDIKENPKLGSHDPSMLWDTKTNKYYSYSTDVYMPQWGLNDRIGIPIRSSLDLINFKYEGTALSKGATDEGRDNGSFPKTAGFWAPYVEYVNGEYRMYYSATKAFGSSESRIWLAVSQNPLGPFENRGVVMDTWGTDDTYPNAIDAHVIWEGEKSYLVYGSFFGGIYIKELDSSSGLSKDNDTKALGKCISRKSNPPIIDGPEGAAIIYVPQTKYYYLFQSYGWLGDTYDIRVGRSKNVSGPYVDKKGRSLAGESMGEKLAGSYCFSAASPNALNHNDGWSYDGYRGPGHGVPFFDPNTENYFFVHHIRDGASIYRIYDENEKRNSYTMHYMMVRPMFFIDGWPALSPEPYAGESLEPVLADKASGKWELIRFKEDDNSIVKSTACMLDKDSTLLKRGIIHKCYDLENDKETLAITGFDEHGVAFWGKLMYSTD